jgi:hypothetical protein
MIFVVGVGRSGTSLLQSMLATNSEILALPETSFLRRYVLSGKFDCSSVKDDKHLERLPDFKRKLLKHINSDKNTDICKVYIDYISSLKSDFVLDKDPRLVEYSRPLLLKLADAKVVHIFRDPRDVLASKKLAAWSSGRSLISYLVASIVQLREALIVEKRYPDFFYSIKYEDLLKNPGSELKMVCEFLNISYELGMLEHTQAATELVYNDELSWKKETLKPINQNNTNKWNKTLTNIEALSAVYAVSVFCKINHYIFDIKDYSYFEIIYSKFIVVSAKIIAQTYLIFVKFSVK